MKEPEEGVELECRRSSQDTVGNNSNGLGQPLAPFNSPDSGFLTITIDPKIVVGYYKLNPSIQHELVSKMIRAYLQRTKIQYYLVPELTKQGNIHFHGAVICDENKKRLLRSYVRRKFGGYSKLFLKIAHPEECMKYCLKDKLYESPLYRIITNIENI